MPTNRSHLPLLAALALLLTATAPAQLTTPPIVFEPNQGQAPSEALFVSRAGDNLIFFTQSAVVFALPAYEDGEPISELVTMHLRTPSVSLGRSHSPQQPSTSHHSPSPKPENPAPGVSHYFHGNDPEKWLQNVPHYREIRYAQIHKGIDLVFRAKGAQIEYDFELQPNADPNQIQLQFTGAETTLDPQTGDLIIQTKHNQMRHRKPADSEQQGALCFVRLRGTSCNYLPCLMTERSRDGQIGSLQNPGQLLHT